MLHYAVVFLVIALIAAVLGFGGVVAQASLAKLLFLVFAGLACAAFLAGLTRKSQTIHTDKRGPT